MLLIRLLLGIGVGVAAFFFIRQLQGNPVRMSAVVEQIRQTDLSSFPQKVDDNLLPIDLSNIRKQRTGIQTVDELRAEGNPLFDPENFA